MRCVMPIWRRCRSSSGSGMEDLLRNGDYHDFAKFGRSSKGDL